MIKIKDLTINPDNPRTISEAALAALTESIKAMPWMMAVRPIVTDDAGLILAGNMRYKALIALGYDEIDDAWAIKLKDIKSEELLRFIIQDNIQAGDWNWPDLDEKFDAALLEAWGLDIGPLNLDLDLDDFNRPEFDGEKPLGTPNKHWLYVEFYHYNEKEFADLVNQAGSLMVSQHQLEPEKFAKLIEQYAAQEQAG